MHDWEPGIADSDLFWTIPVGNGAIDVHGVPKGCLVTSYRELDYILRAYGERITPRTVNKLFTVARHPVTWQAHRRESVSSTLLPTATLF